MRNQAWLSAKTSGLEVHPHLRWLGRIVENGPWMFLHAGDILRPVAKPAAGRRRVVQTCSVFHCRRVVASGTGGRACSHCKMTRWRINNPEQTAYCNVRDRARRKKIPFLITLEEFVEFLHVAGDGYLEGRGKYVGCLHLDRIDPTKGYEVGNLQVLSAEENSRKGACEDKKAQWRAQRLGITVAELRARGTSYEEEDERDDTMHTPFGEEFAEDDNCPF